MFSTPEGKHVRRDSNPQPAVLETAALPIELLTYLTPGVLNSVLGILNSGSLLGLLVRRVLVAEPAVFLVFYSTRLLSLVLGSRVIAMLANSTLECDNISHDLSFVKRHQPAAVRPNDASSRRDLNP